MHLMCWLALGNCGIVEHVANSCRRERIPSAIFDMFLHILVERRGGPIKNASTTSCIPGILFGHDLQSKSGVLRSHPQVRPVLVWTFVAAFSLEVSGCILRQTYIRYSNAVIHSAFLPSQPCRSLFQPCHVIFHKQRSSSLDTRLNPCLVSHASCPSGHCLLVLMVCYSTINPLSNVRRIHIRWQFIHAAVRLIVPTNPAPCTYWIRSPLRAKVIQRGEVLSVGCPSTPNTEKAA